MKEDTPDEEWLHLTEVYVQSVNINSKLDSVFTKLEELEDSLENSKYLKEDAE